MLYYDVENFPDVLISIEENIKPITYLIELSVILYDEQAQGFHFVWVSIEIRFIRKQQATNRASYLEFGSI